MHGIATYEYQVLVFGQFEKNIPLRRVRRQRFNDEHRAVDRPVSTFRQGIAKCFTLAGRSGYQDVIAQRSARLSHHRRP